MTLPNSTPREPDTIRADIEPGDKTENPCDRHNSLEIFRKAIIHADEGSWTILFNRYQGLVRSWLVAFSREHEVDIVDDYDDMVGSTFLAFWRGYTAQKLMSASDLGSVMKYLKMCALTEVLQRRRKMHRRIQTSPLDIDLADGMVNRNPSSRDHIEDAFIAYQDEVVLWEIVRECCNDRRDELLARLSFICNLSPAVIVGHFPETFRDVREVYNLRRNLRDRLMRNERLQRCYTIRRDGRQP